MKHHVVIESKNTTTRLFVDGVELHCITGLSVEFGIQQLPKVWIELSPLEVTVDAKTAAKMIEIQKAQLPTNFQESSMDIEKAIQAHNLTAPRITPERVDAVIIGETFTVLPSCRTTICELTLQNGFTVRGESSCVSIENFRQELGEQFSRVDAKRKVCELEAYLLAERLHVAKLQEQQSAAK